MCMLDGGIKSNFSWEVITSKNMEKFLPDKYIIMHLYAILIIGVPYYV